MNRRALTIIALGTAVLMPAQLPAKAASPELRAPIFVPGANAPQIVPGRLEPRNVPEYAPYVPAPSQQPPARSPVPLAALGTGAALRSGVESATVPVSTRLRLVLEYPVDAKTSVPGDIFEGHVKDDLFLGRTLVLPRGSMVRGRIVEIVKAKLLSRAAKIGLRLDQIVTPTGEVIPLDAALEFARGVTNKAGQLDPGTNLGTRVNAAVKTVAGIDKKTGEANPAILAANVATLGAPIVATAIGSSAIALFRTGDNVSLQPGQELEILLTNDLGVEVD